MSAITGALCSLAPRSLIGHKLIREKPPAAILITDIRK